MSERESLFQDAPFHAVYATDDIEPGDYVAYPAMLRERGRKPYPPSHRERDQRDWLEVTRVEGDRIIGTRVHADAWEDGLEFHVYPLQLRENGVQLVKRS